MADKDKDNDEVEATIADEAVVIKYKTAGEIANRKLVHLGFTIQHLQSTHSGNNLHVAHENRSLTFLTALHDFWSLDLTYKTSRVPGRVVVRSWLLRQVPLPSWKSLLVFTHVGGPLENLAHLTET